MTLTTDTPGFNAEIRAGELARRTLRHGRGRRREDRPDDDVGAHEADTPYLAVWITDLDRVAHVNEVKAS